MTLDAATQQKQEEMFHKIRSLLKKAESTNYEEEAKLFFQKAQELMLKYRIEESVLWVTDPSKRQNIEEIDIAIRDKQPGAKYKRLVLARIATLSQCRMYYVYGGDCSRIAGFPQDLVWVELLYTSIMSQASFAMARAQAVTIAQAQREGGERTHTRTFRNNFYRGFQSRIVQRLEETYASAKQVVEVYTGSSDLVLADRKDQVDAWLNKHVNLQRVSTGPSGKYDANASRHGSFAADATDISGGRGTITNAKPKGALGSG